MKIFNFIGS